MSEHNIDVDSDIENRHEIVFLYDAEQCNPNGDPLSANNMPRVDSETGQAIVTDVRLKRYIRDQLTDEGEGVYILNPQKSATGAADSRDRLFLNLMEMEEDEVKEMDDGELFTTFLQQATDVRLFGATLSFSEELDSDEVSPPQLTGPVQFTHGRSLNRVVPNDESKKLSTVVTSGGDADTGTFADDNRLQYALVNFYGVINEVAADNTGLDTSDIEQLDQTMWKSLLTQTLTRSKMGHHPRMYLRVEYEGGYHNGNLNRLVQIDEERSTDEREMRNIGDVTLDVDALLTQLESDDRVRSVTVCTDPYVEFSSGGEVGDADFFHSQLDESVPEVTILTPSEL